MVFRGGLVFGRHVVKLGTETQIKKEVVNNAKIKTIARRTAEADV